MERRKFLNWMGIGCFASILPEIISTTLPINSLLTKAVMAEELLTTDEVIKKIKEICFPKNLGRIYHRPNDQDREGKGILPCYGDDYNVWGCGLNAKPRLECTTKDDRSELPYLPFVMAPRRQTDSMVRQAYFLLPKEIRRDTAFVVADRLIQYPDPKAYLPYIEKKKKVVLIGSFQGIEDVANYDQYNEKGWMGELHALQLLQLEYSIDLVRSLKKEIVDIVYAIGDSWGGYASTIRKDIQNKFNEILRKKRLEQFSFGSKDDEIIAWGADETMLQAFARQRPEIKVKINISNPEAQQYYDFKETAQTIKNNNIKKLGLKEVKGNDFDIQVFIFTWNPDSIYDFGKEYSLEEILKQRQQQEKWDKPMIEQIKKLSVDQQKKTVIIDARLPNGAWDTLSIPPSDKFLAFGSWGTFGNSFGQTIAMAKLLHSANHQNKSAIQRQLLLEAITHDVFFTGYKEAQHPDSPLQKELKNQNLKYIRSDPYYDSPEETEKVFQVINKVINDRIKADGRQKQLELDNTQFVFVPQLWRTFESEVFIQDGVWSWTGIYRKNLKETAFNPTVAAKNVQKFTLSELIDEKF